MESGIERGLKYHWYVWDFLSKNLHDGNHQVVLDTKLLKGNNLAAKRRRVNRSALIRQALQEHPKQLHILELEERDRRGYEARPQTKAEIEAWEDAVSWPENFSLGCG
jgi:hypothetical protein